MVTEVRFWLAVAIAALLAGGAAAEPVSVEYTIDKKPLKKGATADDVLAFELYSDPNCLSLVHSEPLFAGDHVRTWSASWAPLPESDRRARTGLG